MNEQKLILSEHAAKILHELPRAWEYLLLGQIISDEINLIKIINYENLIKPVFASKFSHVKNAEELNEILMMLGEKHPSILTFLKLSNEISHTNELVFGPKGKPGNPMLINLLAKRVAYSYYDLIIALKEVEFDLKDYDIFLQRNFNLNSEGYKLIGKAIELANLCRLDIMKCGLFIIENYQRSLENDVQRQLKPAELRVDKDEYVVNAGLVQQLGLACDAVHEYWERGEEQLGTLDAQADVSKSFTDSTMVAHWLLSQDQLKLTDLRALLLPLDYFPGAFIDVINEQAFEIVGELALIEKGTVLIINQNILQQVLESEDFYL